MSGAIGSDVRPPVLVLAEQRVAEFEPYLAARPDLGSHLEIVLADASGAVDPNRAAEVDVVWQTTDNTGEWLDRVVASCPALKWIHGDAVGVDRLPLAELSGRGIVVTNGAGIYSRPMAEFVMLGLLSGSKRFPDFVRQSERAEWIRGAGLQELDGSIVVLFGLGSVNSLVAAMLEPFNAEVRAVVRRPRSERPPGVHAIARFDEWRGQLPEADFVVLGMPLTELTKNLIDAEALATMKRDAWIVNVARGALIDESALVAALDRKLIGGAVLDAFATEPLPPEHPLWGRQNVIVIPHFSWSSPAVVRRRNELFLDQLTRWIEGEPLRNVVDADGGY